MIIIRFDMEIVSEYIIIMNVTIRIEIDTKIITYIFKFYCISYFLFKILSLFSFHEYHGYIGGELSIYFTSVDTQHIFFSESSFKCP